VRSIALIIGALVVLVAGAAPGQADQRVALVIGNSSYENAARLRNPVNDADAVAQMFKKAGYEVSLLKDVGSVGFKRELRKFESAANSADIAVVFYAGHAIEIGGTNYMLPVDAKLATDRDARDEAIELERIVEAVEPAKRLRLVIVDACRDNPFLTRMKRRRQALSRATAGVGLGPAPDLGSKILIAYAAKQGETADDGDGEHSPFTTAILHNLPQPGVDIRIAFGRIRDEVLKITANRQEPFVYGSLGGDIISLVPAPERPRDQDNSAQQDDRTKQDYDIVMNAYQSRNDKNPLLIFLKQHPTGFYSDLVRNELNQFELVSITRQPATQGSPDDLVWDQIKGSTDPEAFLRFMKNYPNSPNALVAQHRLDILRAIAREREEDERRMKAEAEAAAKQQKAEAEAEAKRRKAEAEITKAWAVIQGSDDQNRLRDFIRRYPDSQYVSEVKQRLETIIRAAQEREEQKRAAAAETKRQQAEAEMARAFDNAKISGDQAALRDFIRRYPDSQYAAQGKQYLEGLIQAEREREERARAAAAEAKRQQAEAEMLRAFENVRTTTDQAVVRDFIRRYPDSAYVADAKRRLEALVLAEQERKEQERLAAKAEPVAAWNGIKNTSDPAEVQKFIKRFPESPLALNEATQRLGVLDREARERVAKAQAEAAVARSARSAWDRIKNTTDTIEVENFIRRYPNTPTALTEAKQLLDVLDRRAKEREAKARMEAEAAQAWNRIKNTSDSAELQDFIKRYPDSPLALRDARLRIEQLERALEKAQANSAQDAWNIVKNSSDPAELQDFVKHYRNSPLATHDAKQRIELLERIAALEQQAAERADQMPSFPWPPPVPSARYVIPRELFGTSGENNKASMSDIIRKLENALERAAYYERSFYSTPGGIAMITRLERIKPDGSSDESRRWLDVEDGQTFSLIGYLNALLFSDVGHFRLIVFVISNTPFAAVGPPITPSQGSKLLAQGWNTPPLPTLQKPFLPDHQVSVLIYEFQKQRNRTAKQIAPSALPARTHLERSKLWAGLHDR
jgi:outer membrane protein assembly factor BamD (BamD/ComL family)